MSLFSKTCSLALLVSTSLVSVLSAGEDSAEAATVPEPSMAMLGGLCGIFFLLWRKK